MNCSCIREKWDFTGACNKITGYLASSRWRWEVINDVAFTRVNNEWERQQEAIFSVFIDLFCNDVIAFEIGGLQIRTTEKSSSFLEEYGIVDFGYLCDR